MRQINFFLVGFLFWCSLLFAGVSYESLKSITSTDIDTLKMQFPQIRKVQFINFEGMTLNQVLDFFSDEYGLNFMRKDVQDTVLSFYFENAHPLEALNTILLSQGMNWYEKDRFIYIYKGEPIAMIPLNYLKPDEIQETITNMISDITVIPNTATNMFVIKGSLENVQRAKQLIARLDKEPKQVLVEVVILDVDVDQASRRNIHSVLDALDRPDEITPPTGDSEEGTATSGAAASNQGTPVDTAANIFDKILNDDTTTTRAVSPKFQDQRGMNLFQNDASGLLVKVTNQKLHTLIEFFQSIANTETVNTPKILAVNHKPASILTGKRQGYVLKSSQVGEMGGSTVVSENLKWLETGTKLEFTPHITDDGDIIMEVFPELSDGVLDPVTGYPLETTMTTSTTVRVRDGETVIIGGLITTREEDVKIGVPILMHIPVINFLFSKTRTLNRRREKVLILTPHILNNKNRQEFVDQVPSMKKLKAAQKGSTETVAEQENKQVLKPHKLD